MSEFPTDDMEVSTLIVVSDVERSRDWYRDVLGAELYREYGGTTAVFELLGHWLIVTGGGGPTPGKPTVEFAPPADPDRVSTQLTFRVPDCFAAYDTLRSRGAEFLAEPNVREGETRAFFRDPDGHLFEISELT